MSPRCITRGYHCETYRDRGEELRAIFSKEREAKLATVEEEEDHAADAGTDMADGMRSTENEEQASPGVISGTGKVTLNDEAAQSTAVASSLRPEEPRKPQREAQDL